MTILPSRGCSDANGPTPAGNRKTLRSLPSDVRNREFFVFAAATGLAILHVLDDA
jgi:hypothetical protein